MSSAVVIEPFGWRRVGAGGPPTLAKLQIRFPHGHPVTSDMLVRMFEDLVKYLTVAKNGSAEWAPTRVVLVFDISNIGMPEGMEGIRAKLTECLRESTLESLISECVEESIIVAPALIRGIVAFALLFYRPKRPMKTVSSIAEADLRISSLRA